MPEYTIEQITDDAGNMVDADGDGTGDKVESSTFTNQSTVRQDLVVEEAAAGAYADLTYQFPVSVELTLPNWATDEEIAIEQSSDGVTIATAGVSDSATVDPITHKATFEFTAAHGKTVTFKNLPAGTSYKVVESSSRDGVNVYSPSATYDYAGTGAAESQYVSKQNTVTVADGAESIQVNAATGDINTRSLVG